jgi:endogenous inhibitor of DNA gyrase (YacG/DUF329 family)
MTKTVSCPQCTKPVEWLPQEKWKPFCSERCKLIDLGDWAAENHRITDKTEASDMPDIEEFNPSDYH